jgi:hypothetical protein
MMLRKFIVLMIICVMYISICLRDNCVIITGGGESRSL